MGSSQLPIGPLLPGGLLPAVEWEFRDTIRRFLKGDAGMVGPMMSRLYGSSDLFPDDLMNAYHPYQSVNYVTCHDGFCLDDLVSYNHEHNEENGQGNLDGTDSNFSWNCGVSFRQTCVSGNGS